MDDRLEKHSRNIFREKFPSSPQVFVDTVIPSISLNTIRGLQSIPWDLHDKDSAAMLEENKLQIQ